MLPTGSGYRESLKSVLCSDSVHMLFFFLLFSPCQRTSCFVMTWRHCCWLLGVIPIFGRKQRSDVWLGRLRFLTQCPREQALKVVHVCFYAELVKRTQTRLFCMDKFSRGIFSLGSRSREKGELRQNIAESDTPVLYRGGYHSRGYLVVGVRLTVSCSGTLNELHYCCSSLHVCIVNMYSACMHGGYVDADSCNAF